MISKELNKINCSQARLSFVKQCGDKTVQADLTMYMTGVLKNLTQVCISVYNKGSSSHDAFFTFEDLRNKNTEQILNWFNELKFSDLGTKYKAYKEGGEHERNIISV